VSQEINFLAVGATGAKFQQIKIGQSILSVIKQHCNDFAVLFCVSKLMLFTGLGNPPDSL
jgi:hypothetical protein